MKKTLILFGACSLLTLGTSYAQAPARFNYQGIVRDASGNAMTNQAVRLRISIVENTATGTVAYSETQTATTNGFGLYNLAIGNGTPITGTLGNVNWASGPKFIHVEIDAAGSTNYVDLGTSQLLSVPYALSAPAPMLTLTGNSLSAGGNSITLPAPPPPTLTLTGNALSAGGNSVTLPAATPPTLTLTGNTLSAGGNSVTLPSTSAPVLTLTGNSLSAGANSVTLPAPTLTLSGNSLSAGGNSVTLPAATPPTLTLTGNVLSAGGNSVTLPSGGGGTINGTANYVPKFTSATAIGNSSILETSAGKVGIGTTTPAAAKVEIATTDTMALRVTGNSASGASDGLISVKYTGTSTAGVGPMGITATALPSATTASGIGVMATAGLLGVYGVGQANVTTGNVYGVRGEAYSDGAAVAVYGSADGYTTTVGGTKYGVVGFGEGGTTNIGVYGGGGTTGTANYAGYFNGDVEVIGAISKSSGTFKIDHPQDPENKYLYHSFVESPDMMNVYNGNITTDANGYATVTLPGYFESLNKDFRYQLTVVGGTFAQAIVSEKVKGNTFQIRTNVPGTEVSWQVTGIRNDAYAKAHRVQPEVAKEAQNKGKYLNPVELGKSADLQIGRLEVAAPVKATPRK